MAKAKQQSDELKYETSKPSPIAPVPQAPLSPEELAKLEAQRQAEMAQKAKELFESIKNKAEKFKN